MPGSADTLCCAVWPTAWGAMGGVMADGAVSRIILPHYQPDDLRQLLAFEHPGAVIDAGPFEVLIERCRRFFNGRAVRFDDIPCRLPSQTAFAGRVLRACRDIPYGRTVSYGHLGQRIGRPDAARAVATALGRNRIPLLVPCHRIVYADGTPGGFSAPGGTDLKRRLLALEAASP